MKVPILTLSGVLMKICQIRHVIFETTSHFFFKRLCMSLQCHEIYLLCTFLGQMLYTLHERDQTKWKCFRLFSARIIIHQILGIFKTKNQFFLQILHHSSVSWDITTMYLFSWNFIYFQQKEPIKVQIRTLVYSFCKNHIKLQLKKVQKTYLSWHWRVMQSLKKNWLVVSNMTWGIWGSFTQPLKSPNISLWWTILSKVYEVWAKKNTEELFFMKLNSDAKLE